MNTKLTLLLDARTIARAKRYSQLQGTSLSRLVARFLEQLPAADGMPLPPRTSRLIGLLPPRAAVSEYHEHLNRKHR